MEELYRRVSDRQTMGSVVQELRASLSEVEKQIDQYFRDPAQREGLIPVPAQLQAMRGVLSVLDLDHASQAVLRMRDDVDRLSQAEVDPQRRAHQPTFDRLADNLGALSFMIDMLSVQPQMARTLFAFDPAEGRLRAVMGRRSSRLSGFGGFDEAPKPGLVDQAKSLADAAAQDAVADDALKLGLQRLSQQALLADQRQLAEKMVSAQAALERAGDDAERQAVRAGLAQAVAELAAPQLLPELPAERPTEVRMTPAPNAEGDTGLEEDAEMRAIFIEEAREVLQDADAALARLAGAPDDLGELTAIRRAFHTLKGSSRMVGLKAFGEAAWACEQLYNARLAESPRLDRELQQFTARAFADLGRWVDAIETGAPAPVDGAALAAAAERLRGHAPLAVDGAAAVVAPAPADDATRIAAGAALRARIPELPSADDLRLTLDLPEAQTEPAALADLGFTLDLDEPPAAEAPAAVAFELDLGGPAAAPEPTAATEPAALSGLIDIEVPAPAAHAGGPDADAPAGFADTTVEGPPVGIDALVDLAAADPSAVTEPMVLDLAEPPPDEPVKVIGELRIPIPLFNIFLNEADELSRRLCTELAEWGLEWPQRPVEEGTIALAHSLAGSSATVGYAELSALARSLEHALTRSHGQGAAGADEADLFREVAEEIRRLLHQFAAGFLRPASPALRERLEQHERSALAPSPGSSGTPDAWPSPGSSGTPDAWPPAGEPAAAAIGGPPDAATDAAIDAATDAAAAGAAGDAPAEPAAAVPAAAQAEPAPQETADLPTVPGLGAVALTEFSERPMAAAPRVSVDAFDDEQDIDAADQVDEELFPIFRDEGEELLPQLQARMRDWAQRPGEASAAAACMRTLHTFKGGARLAGAMRLGEMVHRLEAAVEHLLARGQVEAADVEALLGRVDTIATAFEQLGQAAAETPAPTQAAVSTAAPAAAPRPVGKAPEAAAGRMPPATAVPAAAVPATSAPAGSARAAAAAAGAIDWARFPIDGPAAAPLAAADKPAGSLAAVRVRAPLLDRLVNQAGEVSITRARIESDVGQIKGSLADLTENLERLRRQLRDLELQAESQIASRMEAAKAAAQDFDPLEMDRFTRFQELTRMMAESVNDVATVHRGLQRSLQATEDELASQARLTRDLQDDLLRTRMVEFESLADRLYRVVRQAAKETGKQVRLDIVGGSIEVDRGVLERMTGPFEHLLRNSVAHGIEPPGAREAAGKETTGTITISLAQEGNEVAVEFRDDGAGLNLARIRERGVARGLLAPDAAPGDAELAALIFHPGFSTAASVSELAGRGVGMDVVRAEVNAMGGRIETATAAGQGASFRLVLPLTTAVTQVVMLRCGELSVAVPSTLVEQVRRLPAGEVAQAYAAGAFTVGEQVLPFFWLGALLEGAPAGPLDGRTQPVVIVRSAAQRIALHVGEVIGNQEVVVKNLGPQLSRLPGLAGITLLPSGAVALIYNPVALAATYGEAARAQPRPAASGDGPPSGAEAAPARVPLVLVVDDSLTVRRVTQRLLTREGYRVALAKDGLDALEKLGEELPAVVLSDIEMPRMDGFDLLRNMRSDPRLAPLPVVMITSRIAQKHRDYAAQLGANHYLGKPYSEEELLALVARYVQEAAAA
jgi:chemosensory pili system protein ChpA (sensor histidine kinase/response regulator)